MTKQVQRRRGTASQHTSFTGAEGEISVNTTNKSVHVHDGVTAGGVEAARADLANVSDASLNTALAGNTLSSLTITSADINGGTIDGTVIGGTTPAAVTATSLTATGTTTLAGASTTADITFGDNDKAIFGAGSDLQIYHDGASGNTYIDEGGAGSLFIRDNDNIALKRQSDNANMVVARAGAEVELYHNGSEKLATTSTGVDVTGTVTADSGYFQGSNSFINDTMTLNFAAPNGQVAVKNSSGAPAANLYLYTTDTSGSTKLRQGISYNGDISFYEDTGTTPKFFWDASAESLGIGTSSPSQGIHLKTASGNSYVKVERTTSSQGEVGFNTNNWYMYQKTNSTDLHFYNTADRMSITSTGNVGIGTSSPSSFFSGASQLVVGSGSGAQGITIYSANNDSAQIFFADGTTGDEAYRGILRYRHDNDAMTFHTAGATERMRIDSSGNVGIGTSSPSAKAHIKTASEALRLETTDTTGDNYIRFDDPSGAKAYFGYVASATDNFHIQNQENSDIIFFTNAAERMRIDASGNLLVGTTNVNLYNTSSDTGIVLRDNEKSAFSRDGGVPLYINRLTSDGGLLYFQKDGAPVGSIGTNGGDVYIGTGDTGVRFVDSLDCLLPLNTSTNATRDAAIDLGYNDGGRFKDLYLSGGLRGDTTFKNNAGTTEYARFDASGNLLVNTTASQSGLAKAAVEFDSGSQYGLEIKDAGSGTTGTFGIFYRGTTAVGSITTNGSTTSYNTSSDYRLKENVVELTGATDRIKQIPVHRFNFIADPETTVDGFLAHEVQAVVPEAITGTKDEVDADGNPVYQGIDHSKLVPLLTAALQEALGRIETLEAEVAALKA